MKDQMNWLMLPSKHIIFYIKMILTYYIYFYDNRYLILSSHDILIKSSLKFKSREKQEGSIYTVLLIGDV